MGASQRAQPSETHYVRRTRRYSGTPSQQVHRETLPHPFACRPPYRNGSARISTSASHNLCSRSFATPGAVNVARAPARQLLTMEAGQPLCLPCAKLDDLEFLPSGDAALTRRSMKYTSKKAVVAGSVARFSLTRGRYQRQGILVEPAALEKIELECTEDARPGSRACPSHRTSPRAGSRIRGCYDPAPAALFRFVRRQKRARSTHRCARQRSCRRSAAGRGLEEQGSDRGQARRRSVALTAAGTHRLENA